MRPEKLNHEDTARRVTENGWDTLEKYPPTGRLKEIIDQFNEERVAAKAERIRAAEEEERIRKAETKEAFRDMAKSAAVLAAGGLLVISSLFFINKDSGLNSGPSSLEEQNYYNRVRSVQVESVTFTGSPNLRSQPHVSDRDDLSNSYGTVHEDSATISMNGTMYILDGMDPNGPWYGFDAAEISRELVDENYISKGESKKISGDKDGVVWVSSHHADYERSNTNTIN